MDWILKALWISKDIEIKDKKKKHNLINLIRFLNVWEVIYLDCEDKDVTSIATLYKIKVITERWFFINMRWETIKLVKVTLI